MRVVGKIRNKDAGTPADAVARAWRLIQAAGQLATIPRARGFVVKARTHEEFEDWKRAQSNPRLW